MPTTVTVGSNYNGKVAGGLFLKAWKDLTSEEKIIVSSFSKRNSGFLPILSRANMISFVSRS